MFDRNIELMQPVSKVTIGGKLYLSAGVDTIVASKRGYFVDVATVTIPNVDGELVGKIKEGDTIVIEWGYTPSPVGFPPLTPIFNGYVEAVKEGKTVFIEAIDLLGKANNTKIQREYKNDTPDAIVKNVCEELGLKVGNLPSLPQLPRVVLNNLNLSGLIKNIENHLAKNGHDLTGYTHFVDINGFFQWGPKETAQNPAVLGGLEVGAGVITQLTHGGGQGGFMKTISLPWLRHSTDVKINEEKLSGVSSSKFIVGVMYIQSGRKMRQEVWFE